MRGLQYHMQQINDIIVGGLEPAAGLAAVT
jgi:hypothetical protein